ncbi:unnamed protein product [Colias eurytheme]|nr:unnamed protein product [Colias eurytheme]
MHRFPDCVKYPERFMAWVALVGGILQSESDYEHYKNKRICDVHFSEKDKNRNNRLNALAIPTLNLSERFETQIPQVSTSMQQQQTSLPPTSNTEQFGCNSVLEQASSSKDILPSQAVNTGNTCTNAVSNSIMLEHNCISRKPRTSRKGAVGSLFTQIKLLRSEVSRLRKKGQTITRLRNAEALSEYKVFQHFARMSKPAQLFVRMQLESSKTPKGRRFTNEEKVLSLSLFKKSPKSYAHLCKYFILPSLKSMKRLLSTIKIHPGINSIMFKKIKESVLEKPKPFRLCSLIFDEMSLTPHVNYNVQRDIFEGFASNQIEKFADQALVFMIKGLKEHFKQPIAYYYTNCLNKQELKGLIKTVVQHAQDAGLIIANTVCDQSTINVGAITELVNETRVKYLRLNKEWRYDMFCVNGKNIIPLYDTPHLIKGIRNNLLNKDLLYTSNGEQKVVKWEYFQKLCS